MLGGAGCAHLGERAKIRGRHLGKGNERSSLRWAPPPQSTEAVHVSSLTMRAEQHLTGANVCVQGPGARAEPCSAFPGLVQGEAQHTAPAQTQSAQTKGLPNTACMQEAQPSCFRHGGSMLGIDSPESSRVGGGGSKLPVKAHPMLFKGS